MITEAEKVRLLILIEGCLIYEGQVSAFTVMKDEHPEGAIHDLAKASYDVAYKGAERAGKDLLNFLDEITEKNNEII